MPFRRSAEEEPASNPFYEIPMHWETPTPEERGKESPEQEDDDIPGKQLTSSSPAVPESEVRGTFPMQVTTEGSLDEFEFETEASAYEFDEEAWQEKSQRESDQSRGSTHEPESDIKRKCRPSLRKRRARRRRELESQGMLVPQRGRGSTIATHRKAANEPSHSARPPRVNPQAEGGKVLKKEPQSLMSLSFSREFPNLKFDMVKAIESEEQPITPFVTQRSDPQPVRGQPLGVSCPFP